MGPKVRQVWKLGMSNIHRTAERTKTVHIRANIDHLTLENCCHGEELICHPDPHLQEGVSPSRTLPLRRFAPIWLRPPAVDPLDPPLELKHGTRTMGLNVRQVWKLEMSDIHGTAERTKDCSLLS